MNKKSIEALAAHAEQLTGHPDDAQTPDLTDQEREQLAPLFQLAEQLYASMPRVQPPAAFVRSLRKELMEQTTHQLALEKRRRRRTMVIGAATAGSLVSIASLVGAIAFVVARLRARAQAQAIPVQTA